MRRRARFADILADATMVAVAAVRQTVKNLVLVRALRDAADFDPAWYAEAVRREFEIVAQETEADAERLTTVLARARRRRGSARHASDYRSADQSTLRLRIRTFQAVAEELRRLATDDAFVTRLIDEARSRALDEIAGAAASVPGAGITQPLMGVDRSRAIQRLRTELRDYDDD